MGKAALITGSAKRLGKAMALGLASQGYDIALHYNHSHTDALRTAELIREQGRVCELFRCNLYNLPEVRGLVPRVIDKMPQCEILINNASMFDRHDFFHVTEDSLDRDMQINFKVPFFLTQTFSGTKSARLVINMLDTRISGMDTEHFTYYLSKRALADFTKMAAKVLGPRIRVNGICPGPILAPPGEDAEYLEEIAKRIPLKKAGNPDYILSALIYLLENEFITGELLFVDGGEHLRWSSL